MTRVAPQTLKANEFENTNGVIDLSGLTVGGDILTFEVGTWDWFNIQLVLAKGASWTATTTILVTCSNDGANFADFPTAVVPYASVGMKERIRVTGCKQVRLGGGTATGSLGDAVVAVIVRGSQE